MKHNQLAKHVKWLHSLKRGDVVNTRFSGRKTHFLYKKECSYCSSGYLVKLSHSYIWYNSGWIYPSITDYDYNFTRPRADKYVND
jgi:hypothetical protein